MAARDYIPLNFELLHPVNVLLILSVIAIGGLAVALLFPAPSPAE